MKVPWTSMRRKLPAARMENAARRVITEKIAVHHPNNNNNHMKKLLLVIAIGFFMLPASAQFSKAVLQATGLTCAMCSNAINKALQKIPFVESVKSDIKNSAFSITFKPGTDVDPDALKEAVEDAGFAIGSLKLTGNFTDLKVEKDQHIKIGKENFHFVGSGPERLNGEQSLTVVDKHFVTEKQYKKYSTATKMNCMQTGKAGACCKKDGITENERIFHFII
jgi:copper chaperone CopZ